MATTLTDLRKRAGLTPPQVMERLKGMGPDMPQDRTWIHQIEKRGVSKFAILRALAIIYGVTVEEVEEASRATAAAARQNNSRQIVTSPC